jgi:hypothetical protein
MNLNGTQGSLYQGLTQVRPYDFGTDAIERQRVSLGQSLIDADFEYGLQATKWQTYQELRRFPSFFEIPGTDYAISNVVSDGTATSNITVYFSNVTSLPPPIGTVISIQGLSNAEKNADRAEGFFLITANNNTTSNTANYISKGLVSTTTSSNVQTAGTVLRRGGIFNSGQVKIPLLTVTADGSPGTNVFVTTAQAHGLMPGTPLTANASGTSFNGNFFVSNVTSLNTFNIVCTSTITGATLTAAISNIYMNPYSYAVHRPFDGGVLMTPNQPSYGAAITRQSKKVFRYQSGKGLLWSSGTLFCPNNDISTVSIDAASLPAPVGSNIIITTSISHGVPQPGATIIIKGISTANVNGTYTVNSVNDSKTINVLSTGQISTLTPVLADQPRFIMSAWHGASVRAGCFDDQNGMFWEYDGQTLFAVKRSSTFQISGTANTNVNSQVLYGTLTSTTGALTTPSSISVAVGDTSATITVASHTVKANMHTTLLGGFGVLGVCWVTATTPTSVTVAFTPATSAISGTPSATTFVLPNTRFQDQLRVNDKITIKGMTHQVTSIQGQGVLTFNPPFRGAANVPVNAPATVCRIKEIRTPQSQFNRDTIDGNGASGFKVDLTKMQMTGLQYTWYGAGFIDFMMRGADGNWVYAHRIRNNNINDESYMRTGNMPVRYELVNECQSAVGTLATALTAGQTTITINELTTYFPPAGTLQIDQELISYSSKTANSFNVIARGTSLNYNINDINRIFTGQSASTHVAGTTVTLVSVTCTPSLTHWGSAFLMDGNFDNDRGYFFNYANVSVNVTAGSVLPAFAIRLAPSVSNGVIGDIGSRDLLNRAQMLLQKLEVTSANTVTTIGYLNPSNVAFNTTSWVSINSQGGQPSFAQIYPGNLITTIPQPGERIFQTIVQGNNQNNLDLSALKEMTNAVIGGNQPFPDGPDVLTILVQNNSSTAPSGPVQVNLFWSEAQA